VKMDTDKLIERMEAVVANIPAGDRVVWRSASGLMREAATALKACHQKEQQIKDAIIAAFGKNPIASDGVLLVSVEAYNDFVEIVNLQPIKDVDPDAVWNEGYDAFFAKMGYLNPPYASDTEEYKIWMEGFDFAENVYTKNRKRQNRCD